MQLHFERPDYTFVLRGADGQVALVNDRQLTRSFVLSPEHLLEHWPVDDVTQMLPGDLDALFALQPELVLIGCGTTQRFPPAATLAACLSRGIGLESMVNAAAARTFNVLASEGRRVVAGFVLNG